MYLQIYFHKIDMYVKNLTQVSLDIMSRSSEVILYNQPYIAMLLLCIWDFCTIFSTLYEQYQSPKMRILH